MKQTEVKELSIEELEGKLAEFVKSYASLRSSHALTPLENPLELRKQRRIIARIKTELSKRVLQEA